jgi:hypothetical protein
VAVAETRRARAWTGLAVLLARQAAEVGRERLDVDRPVRVVGVLPDPDAVDEEATGRQLRPDAAAERDERAQIGLLAETVVDAILIEPRPSLDRTRVALRAVLEHELLAWVALPEERPDGLSLSAWCEALAADGASMVLLSSPDGPPTTSELGGIPFGWLSPGPPWMPDPPAAATRWLEEGAHIIGIAAGATADALRPLVEARDAAMAASREATSATRSAVEAWARDAATRASGGKAIWLGDPPKALPDGFAWTIAPVSAVATLPPAAWRLLISEAVLDPREGARLVERGGIIAASTNDVEALAPLARAAGVRLDVVTPPVAGEWRYIGRRED